MSFEGTVVTARPMPVLCRAKILAGRIGRAMPRQGEW